MIIYSRPIYFSILCGLILLLDAGSKTRNSFIYTVYDLKISPESFQVIRDHVIGELLVQKYKEFSEYSYFAKYPFVSFNLQIQKGVGGRK